MTKTILRRFEAQRHRGTTSFGFYLPETNTLCHNVKEGRIKTLLKRTKGENHEVLFHHRLSTSTPDVLNACHPFSTKGVFSNNYVGVHNGIVWNDNELERKHSLLGIKYVSRQNTGEFNDSEALIYEIARYLEGQIDNISARGSIAFIIIKRNSDGKPSTLFFGRNDGNPLRMKQTKHSLTISSEGEGKMIDTNLLYAYDYETKKLTTSPMIIPKSYSYSNSYSSSFDKKYDTGYTPYKEYDDVTDDDFMPYFYGEALDVINQCPFQMRFGTSSDIFNSILEDEDYDYDAAAIAALTEVEEINTEKMRVNKFIEKAYKSEAYDRLSEYWWVLDAYSSMMKEIAEKLEARSVELVLAKDDDKTVREYLDKHQTPKSLSSNKLITA